MNGRRLQGLGRWLEEHQLSLLVSLGGAALVMGFVGFSRAAAQAGEDPTALDILYRALSLFVCNYDPSSCGPLPQELELARFLAPGVTLITAVAALLVLLQEQHQRLTACLARGHVVITGLGEKGYRLAVEYHRRGRRVVVLELDEENDWIPPAREAGVTVIPADATDPEQLAAVRTERAERLIAITGDGATNARIAAAADTLLQSRGRSGPPLRCYAALTDRRLTWFLKERSRSLTLRIRFFNYYEAAAELILKAHPPFVTGGIQPPRPLLLGLGNVGEHVLLSLARQWRAGGRPERLAVQVIDRDAENRLAALRAVHPELVAVEVQVAGHDITAPEVMRREFLDRDQLPTVVYIALGADSSTLLASLTLAPHLIKKDVPIVAIISRDEGLSRIREMANFRCPEFDTIKLFGLLDRVCRPELWDGTEDDDDGIG